MVSFQGKEEVIKLIQRVKHDQHRRSKRSPFEGMRETAKFSSGVRKCLEEMKERAARENGNVLKELKDILRKELE